MKLLIGLFSIFSIFFDLTLIDGEVVQVIILNRHGARTSTHSFPEIENYFPGYEKGVLTYNGWRQQILLGKYIRNKYLTRKQNIRAEPYLKIDNPSKQFLILSSPFSRTIESAIAYSLGLFPDYYYNIVSPDSVTDKNRDMPPIKNLNPDSIVNNINTFYIMLPDKMRDILFHGKKCKTPKDDSQDQEDLAYIDNKDKKIIYDYFKITFPQSMKDITIDNMSISQIKSLYSAIICVNFNFENEIFKMPKEVEDVMSKFLANYTYLKRLKYPNIISSQFFDEIIKMFDFNVNKNQKGSRQLNFFNNTQINYDDLKLVVFSGHDTNILAVLKNLVKDYLILSLLKNPKDNIDFLIPKFSSSIEFHLIKRSKKYYVKFYYNGINVSDRITNSHNGEIEYEKFKELLLSKIYPNYQNCEYKSPNTDED